MLVVFEKTTGHIKASFSDNQKIEIIYRNSPEVLSKLGGVYIDDNLIPKYNITNYKLVDNEIVSIPIEDFQQTIENPLVQQIDLLQIENNQFKQLLNLAPPIMNPISLQDYQENKIYELKVACNQTILNGFYSSCKGVEEFYSCSQLDQNNIKGYIALLGVNSDLDNIIWKSASETLCTPFTAEQMIILGSDMMHHVQNNIYKFELLRNQVMECETVECIGEIIWVDNL